LRNPLAVRRLQAITEPPLNHLKKFFAMNK
jgi:hypothetical protein